MAGTCVAIRDAGPGHPVLHGIGTKLALGALNAHNAENCMVLAGKNASLSREYL